MINELIDFDKTPIHTHCEHGLNYVFLSVNKGSCVSIKIL